MSASKKQPEVTEDLVRKLISESVDEALDEGLRGGFNLAKFKSFTDLYDMTKYAKEHLSYIGAGSSRMTFALSSGKVLKLAKHNSSYEDAGRDQNKEEVEVSTTPGVSSIITKVFDFEPKFNWIISELVRPFNDEGYEESIGMDLMDFGEVLDMVIKQNYTLKEAIEAIREDSFTSDHARTLEEILKPDKIPVVSNLLKQIKSLAKRFNMPKGDLVAPDHYGKTANGRVVLLDYGLSWDVGMAHYGFDRPRNLKQASEPSYVSVKPPSGKSKFFSSASPSSSSSHRIQHKIDQRLQQFKPLFRQPTPLTKNERGLSESIVRLIEEIFAQEAVLTERLKGNFNLAHFKSLKSPIERVRYADENLPKLGEGSSRAVFALSGNKVLKIAWDKILAGFAQNEQEVELSTNPAMKPIVARVYDAAPDYSWIISEITRPFKGYDAFEHSIGLPNKAFDSLLRRTLDSDVDYEEAFELVEARVVREIEMTFNRHDPDFSTKVQRVAQKTVGGARHDILKPLIEGIREMKKAVGLNIDDLTRYDHYGKTADGRVVIIDYGFNSDIRNKFYNGF